LTCRRALDRSNHIGAFSWKPGLSSVLPLLPRVIGWFAALPDIVCRPYHGNRIAEQPSLNASLAYQAAPAGRLPRSRRLPPSRLTAPVVGLLEPLLPIQIDPGLPEQRISRAAKCTDDRIDAPGFDQPTPATWFP